MSYPGHRPRAGAGVQADVGSSKWAKLARERKAAASRAASTDSGHRAQSVHRPDLKARAAEQPSTVDSARDKSPPRGEQPSTNTGTRKTSQTSVKSETSVSSYSRGRRVSFSPIDEDSSALHADVAGDDDGSAHGSRRVSFGEDLFSDGSSGGGRVSVSEELRSRGSSSSSSRRVSFGDGSTNGGGSRRVSFGDAGSSGSSPVVDDRHHVSLSAAGRRRVSFGADSLASSGTGGGSRRSSHTGGDPDPATDGDPGTALPVRSILKSPEMLAPGSSSPQLPLPPDELGRSGDNDSQHADACAPRGRCVSSTGDGMPRPQLVHFNSAEERYGVPPKPYIRSPISVDRRLPAPTLQQQMRGARRRPTGSTKNKGSTWQVEDFVMQPTTIDFKGVSYSPEHRTLRSRAAGLLRRLTDGSHQRGSMSAAVHGANDPDTHFILKNLTFRINPGSLVAVMGPSGSGKTSLLDVIAKRYEGQLSGGVYFNNKRWTTQDVKEHVGYVLQNDNLLPSLTVMETLVFMGKLSLPPSITDEELRRKAGDIIKELGLSHVADSQVGDGEAIRGLSGGERRRVSMGVQLLVAPGVILLDEPTTGLDSFNANQLLRTLTKLTRKQHLVMITIHQPKSDLFRMFNDVIMMNGGEMIWAGPSQLMLAHFDQIGFPCPSDANPLQYFVTLSSVSKHTEEDREATEERVASLKTAFTDSQFHQSVCEEIGWDATALKRLRQRATSGRLELDDPYDRPSRFSKLITLTQRAWANTFRSRGAVFTRTLQLPLLALYLLLFFTRLDNDQQSVQNRNGLVLETLVEVTLASAVTAISLCPPLRERYHREAYEGLYGAVLFLASYFLHSMPFAMVSSFLWTVVMYFGAGLQLSQASAVFVYWLVVFLLHLVGECIAVLMLGLVSSIPLADSVTTFFIMVGIALGGGVYRVSSTVPRWLEILSYLTPFKYSGAIMQVNEMSGLQLTGCESSISTAAIITVNTTSPVASTSSSPLLGNESVADAGSTGLLSNVSGCLWEDGDAYLRDSLNDWQMSLSTNFGALLGLLMAYYIITFIVFECRKKLLH